MAAQGYCSVCGTKLAGTERFCPSCGRTLDPGTEQSDRSEAGAGEDRRPVHRARWFLPLAILAVAIVAGGVYVAVRTQRTTGPGPRSQEVSQPQTTNGPGSEQPGPGVQIDPATVDTNEARRACMANERTMEGAIQQFNAEAGDYGGQPLSELAQLIEVHQEEGVTFGPYLKQSPVCPGGGTYTLQDGVKVLCSVHGQL